MTELRSGLRDIADDAPDLEAVRQRLRRPRRRLAPALAAAGVVAVALAAAAVLSSREPAPPGDVGTVGGPDTASTGPQTVTTITTTTTVDATGSDVVDPGPSVQPTAPATAAPTDPWNGTCYGVADLSTDLRVGASWGQKPGAVNTAPRPEDYLDICGSHWQTGVWSEEPTLNPDFTAPTAPEGLKLAVCVLPDGSYGIFPGTDATCSTLGLPLAVAPDPTVGVIETPSATS